jgi:hypothetical protein
VRVGSEKFGGAPKGNSGWVSVKQGRMGQVQNCEWLLPTQKGGMPSRGIPQSKCPGRILRPWPPIRDKVLWQCSSGVTSAVGSVFALAL